MVLIGEFSLRSDNIVLSDPLADYLMTGQARIENARKGKWRAYVKRKKLPGFLKGSENFALIAAHESIKNIEELAQSPDWEDLDEGVLVEEEIAGLFDGKYFDQRNKKSFREEIDRLCLLDRKKHAEVFDSGVICFAGFGNGCYPAYVLCDESNHAVAVMIEFIDDG
jgi:hypothetical protein